MNNTMLKKVLFSALLLAFSWPVYGAENLEVPLPLDPQVRIGKLDNGLTYYIRKNAKPENKVELRLVVKAGSILEDDDQQGLAHFTEHMAFDGSRHFKKHELVSYLQNIGVKFGADLNAYTSFDETVYILPIPTDKPENLETGFLVLEDWAQGVTMEDGAIDQERNIVLEEARMGKGADDRMVRKLLPEVFNGSQYAKRIPIGKESILKHFPHAVIRRFYADWYRPDLMAVIVVGDVDTAQAEKMVRAHFEGLKNPVGERPRKYVDIPSSNRTSGLVITDREATENVVRIGYPVRKFPPDLTIADYRKGLIKNLFTSMLTQRLQELTQQENPPFIGAYSGEESLAPGFKSFTSSVYLGRGGAAPAITAVVQENARARLFGFNQEEMERAKKRMHRDAETAYNERNKSESSGYVREYIGNFLEQEPIPGIANEYAYITDLLPGISLDEVNSYTRQVIPGHSGKMVAYMGSSHEKEKIPTTTQLLKLVKAAEKTPLTAKAEKNLPSALMAQPPKAGSIVGEKQDKKLGTIELALSNGVNVILKPTDFKNDQVMIGAARFGGRSLYGEHDMYSARYSSSVVYSMGLDSFTPLDLTKIMSGKSASLYTSIDGFTESISGSAGIDDIESLFQLLYMRMMEPRKDETLFHAFVSKSQDMAKESMSNPETVFYDMLQTTLYNNHPRLAHVAKPEDFSHIDLDRALAIYRDRFGSAKGMTFVMVGSFDVEKIKPLIATYLASLPAGEIPTRYQDLGMRPITGVVKKEMRIGIEPKSRVSLAFTGDAAYSREENRRMRMLMEVMNIRIVDNLRQKLSLIYSGGMSGAIDRVPYASYRINVNLPCGPENVDKVVSALFAEIEKIKKEGPTKEEIDKVKKNWIEEYRIAMRTNSKWLASLQDAALFGTDPAAFLSDEEGIDAITPEEIKAAANRYFNTGNYVQAVLYPEKQTKVANNK
jgi:zinc protease